MIALRATSGTLVCVTLTDEAPGRRARKKRATHAAIEAAALALVAERGLAALTVEAIADRADIAPRTFFNHFPSKEAAVVGWNPARADDVADDLRSALADGAAPLEAIEAAMLASLEREAFDHDAFVTRTALVRSEPVLLAASFTAWQQMTAAMTAVVADVVGPGAYPALVVAVAVAAARTAIHEWAAHPDTDLQTDVRDAFASLRAGMPAPTERHR